MGNIKFSGAHCDEHGKISGGAAGDQTGREVCTKDAYMHSKGWVVLRHPDAAIAKKVAKFAKAIADNNNFGYDQEEWANYCQNLSNGNNDFLLFIREVIDPICKSLYNRNDIFDYRE